MTNTISACFSGHRQEEFDFYDSVKAKALGDCLIKAMLDALDGGFGRFYCGMAQGFDIFAAEHLVDLRNKKKQYDIKLIAAVPYKNHHTKWGEFWRKKCETILQEADEIIILSEEYYTGCFHYRNRFMVDNSELVICNYNGKAGGTKSTINYAEKNFKKVVNVNSMVSDRKVYQMMLY